MITINDNQQMSHISLNTKEICDQDFINKFACLK